MDDTTHDELLAAAARALRGYLASGVEGLFVQGWDRLNAAGLDVDLRRVPSVDNARALLWLAQGRV